MKNNTSAKSYRLVAKEYVLPMILITTLFFMWGGARAVLDVLNKHYQLAMDVSKTRSALIQTVVYIAYFVGAYPSGLLIKRLGTRKGVIIGLATFAAGSFLFIPIGGSSVFELVLAPLFIIGCGLVLLETAANPYVTLLGAPQTAAGRLNVAQSFNGLGSMIVSLGSGLFLFSSAQSGSNAGIAVPYTVLAVIMLVVAVCFAVVQLPEVVVKPKGASGQASAAGKRLGAFFWFGFIALLCYEVSEISINSFFINFMTDDGFLTPSQATWALSMGGLLLFMLGRVVGGVIMTRVRTELVLAVFAVGTVATVGLAMMPLGVASKVALIVCYAFESIMFPTIFALSIKGLGLRTEHASSILMMSVVGGAIGPLAMGWIADNLNIRLALAIPLSTFVVVLAFALYALAKSRREQATAPQPSL